MDHQRVFRLLALNIFLCFCIASPSVPIATDPILSTETIPTVIPSLVTIYSIVPATDAVPDTVTTITTTIDGQTTTVVSTGVIAGSITSTIISTISLTTSQVVVNTVGYSTILGPDPTPATTAPVVAPTTAAPNPETPILTTSSPLGEVPTSSNFEITSTLTTSSSISATSSSTASSSSSSPLTSATGSDLSSQTSHSSSTSKGLSTGAKAGIGVGVALGVILLALLSFLLGQRYSRRRNENARNNASLTGANEKDIFLAGRPYEASGPRLDALAGGKSYDMPGSDSVKNYANNSDLSALPPVGQGDEPMYVGVPAHMSGSKRWSMKEFVK
ncbi:hypothetical protein AYO21_06974 [Fonsecaea monophora]|uniref:Mid2 domain-containing protein n=1 Tax=Fonsecaea monophora TaxID=254056 RepID=A0A177F654_9EURO|nr:hypothetical protein AYO21_06974 [Fonsecaea monophora]OAG38779.1 hypothetical protein AYO21_06974 [Fonsecaea monophora]